MKPWTKADVGRLTSTIDSFWVCNRPLVGAFGPARDDGFNEAFTKALADKRVEIVLAGLRSNRAVSSERAAKNRETAEHYRTHPEVYGPEDTDKRRAALKEIVERFEKFAKEEVLAGLRLDKLIARVEYFGLPAEVASYDPRAR